MNEGIKLTAKEVRALPVGTKVELHGYDRRGIPCWTEFTVQQSYKKKVLVVRDYYGEETVKQIREYPNKYYTLKKVE